ncbi:arrestin homolog [Diabrotica undecimpunctata]|uniref:arrestin homolog n=1 Tax=Diabrotica undecimpunctata TaxID=50387 RepID=UPI003B63B42C
MPLFANMTSDDSPAADGIATDTTKCEHGKLEAGAEKEEKDEKAATQIPDGMSAQRVYKKVSPNQKLTLYLSSRDLVVSPNGIDSIQGILLVDPEFVEERKVYGQVTLTFRYGREDEEVMGLKFCNEAIMCIAQLYPPTPVVEEMVTPLQEALMKRLGENAYPFTMTITPFAPPSVQLVPAKEYHGAPIGTCYDFRAYVDRVDEKLLRRSTIRMGIRVVQRAFAPPSPHLYVPGGSGKTGRERAKHNRKALLFGLKTTPMDVTCPKSEKESKNLHILGNFENQENQGKRPHYDKTIINEKFRDKATLSARPSGLEMDIDKDHDVRQGNGGESAKISGKENADTNAGDVEIKERKVTEILRNTCVARRLSLAQYVANVPCPKAYTEKLYLLSEGKICLTTTLNKAIYSHGEDVNVTIHINNRSNKTVKRLKVFIVQHVDVCMFSNGKFKNVVALHNAKHDCPIHSNTVFEKTYSLVPIKGATKNWIALEESYNRTGASLASTVTSPRNAPDDRNVFAIYVSYYVKVKLLVNRMGGDLSLKLPFTLMHTCCDLEQTQIEMLASEKPPEGTTPERINPDLKPASDDQGHEEPGGSRAAPADINAVPYCKEDVKPEKDGT